MIPIVLLKSPYLIQICLGNIELRPELRGILRSVIEALRSFLSRPVRLVHFVNGYPKHHHVEEDDLCEVVHALAECQVVWNGSNLPKSLLLNDYPVQCDLEPVANLSERSKELVTEGLLRSASLGLEHADQSVVYRSKRVPYESQGRLAHWHWHFN